LTAFHIDEQRLLDCVHCGFCLSACPTFNVLGNEMDSPRGRIYLMRLLSEGRLEPTPETLTHFDLCLGCLACETACPAGVQYRHLIEETRSQARMIAAPGYLERLQQQVIDMAFPHPAALLALLIPLRIARRIGIRPMANPSGWLAKLMGPMELIPQLPPLFQQRLPESFAARGEGKYRVGLISGCVMNALFRETNRATMRVLARAGCEVVIPSDQCCCGALLVHGGNPEEARKYARKNVDVFEPLELDAIIVNAAGCGATLKAYEELLRDEPSYRSRAAAFSRKVRDISEWLVEIGYRTEGDATRLISRWKLPGSHNGPLRLTYHDACHLCHGQGIREQPRALLRSIPGIEWVELRESDMCCGSAGTYNLTQPEMADSLLQRKVRNLDDTKADLIATGNPGCQMQIQMGLNRAGLDRRVVHPVEILDTLAD
jgi:glycolate oxidase iron-sulfur subunit